MFVMNAVLVPRARRRRRRPRRACRTATSISTTASASTSGWRIGTPVSGSAIASRPAPIASARTAPPTLSPRLTSHAAHRRREHVVDVAVEARLEDRRGVVRVRGLRHSHRDQSGDDEDLVVEAVDLLDAPADREPEDEDEQGAGQHGRGDRLRPQLRDAVDLATGQGEQAAMAAANLAHAATCTSGRARRAAVERDADRGGDDQPDRQDVRRRPGSARGRGSPRRPRSPAPATSARRRRARAASAAPPSRASTG